MKRMVFIFGILMSSTQGLIASPIINISYGIRPIFDSGWTFGYRSNIVSVLLGGQSSDIGTVDYYEEVANSCPVERMINTPNFYYWNGTINPSGAYSNAHGSALGINAIIEGDGEPISLDEISYSISSTVPGLADNDDFSLYPNLTYTSFLIGLDSDGSGGYTWTTSGSATNLHQKIAILLPDGLVTSGNGTPNEQIAGVINSINYPSPVTSTFNYNYGGNVISDSQTIQVVPEPATIGMLLFGGTVLYYVIYVRRKNK